MKTEVKTSTRTKTIAVVSVIAGFGIMAAAGFTFYNKGKTPPTNTQPKAVNAIVATATSKTAAADDENDIYPTFQAVVNPVTGKPQRSIASKSRTLENLKKDYGLEVTTDNKIAFTMDDGATEYMDADEWVDLINGYDEFMSDFGVSVWADLTSASMTGSDSTPVPEKEVAQVVDKASDDLQAYDQAIIDFEIVPKYLSLIEDNKALYTGNPAELDLDKYKTGSVLSDLALGAANRNAKVVLQEPSESDPYDTGKDKTYYVDVGDDDWFSIDGFVSYRSEGSDNYDVKTTTGMYLNAHILGKKKELIQIENTGESSHPTANNHGFNYTFFTCIYEKSDGSCLYGPDEEFNNGPYDPSIISSYYYEPDIPTKEKKVSQTVWFGVIPVELELGARINPDIYFAHAIGLDYDLGTIIPSIDIDGLASAEVDVVAVSVSVNANITLADVGMTLENEMLIDGDYWDNRVYKYAHSGTWDASFLDGKVKLVIRIKNPFGKDPKYTYTLVKWDGWDYSGNLLDPNPATDDQKVY